MLNYSWQSIKKYSDIKFDFYSGVAKITINRPKVYNAFRPETNVEMLDAMDICRERNDIDIVVITGQGNKAFCSGGDQNVKGSGGYIGKDGVPRLNILDLHKKIREIPKPVIAMVNGYAIGGGHVLHVVCDLSIASDNAIFGQTGPKVGSFDGGFGSSYLARHVGQKKAREIWFLCKQYSAKEAKEMGMVNEVVPYEKLEKTIGQKIDEKDLNTILNGLEIKINNVSETGIGMTIPRYRVDVTRPADVIEEILRVYGYNRLEEKPLTFEANPEYQWKSVNKLENTAALKLSSLGFYEILNNSLASPDYKADFYDSIYLVNPLGKELSKMRQSLIHQALEVVSFNLNRQNKQLKLYEFGNVYGKNNDEFIEEKRLSITLSGSVFNDHWERKDQTDLEGFCLHCLSIESILIFWMKIYWNTSPIIFN